MGKKEVSPGLIAVVVVVFVAVLALFGYKSMTGHMPGGSKAGANPYSGQKPPAPGPGGYGRNAPPPGFATGGPGGGGGSGGAGGASGGYRPNMPGAAGP